jgi:4'-phosphopantetheinyl transferase
MMEAIPTGTPSSAPDRSIVDVVAVALEQPAAEVARLEAALGEREMEIAGRLSRPELRRRYVVVHGALREMLGGRLGVPAHSLEIAADPGGKPCLAGCARDRDLRFNLSHSGELAVIAVAASREVGVDVERLRPLERAAAIAARFFTAAEASALAAVEASRRDAEFLALWSAKEAYGKARGEGLSESLRHVSVGPVPAGTGEPFTIVDAARASRRWSGLTVHPRPGYVGALVVEGSGWRLRTEGFTSPPGDPRYR